MGAAEESSSSRERTRRRRWLLAGPVGLGVVALTAGMSLLLRPLMPSAEASYEAVDVRRTALAHLEELGNAGVVSAGSREWWTRVRVCLDPHSSAVARDLVDHLATESAEHGWRSIDISFHEDTDPYRGPRTFSGELFSATVEGGEIDWD